MGGTDFDRRMLCINKEIIGPRYELMKTGQLDKSKESFSIRCKQFWDLHLSGKVDITSTYPPAAILRLAYTIALCLFVVVIIIVPVILLSVLLSMQILYCSY